MSDIGWLLLCDESPALRHRVLTELLGVPADDAEVVELDGLRRRMPAIDRLTGEEPEDLRDLSWRLCRLANLGCDRRDERVSALAEQVFARQARDGSFPLREFRSDDRYDLVPLQVSLPLRGLAAVGYATEERAERAYDWLLEHQLEDGAWPAGRAAGQPAYVAGYRKLPGSAGCRANTQAALACMVRHPVRRGDATTRRALDLLLQRETRDEWALGTDLARLLGAEPVSGFFTFYARFDLAHVLDIAAAAGASIQDPRLADLVDFLLERRGPSGLWEHPAHPELGRWLSFDLSRSISRLADGDWAGAAPRTRFRSTVHRRH